MRLFVTLFTAGLLAIASDAFSADKGGMTRHEAEVASPAPVSWTGCGGGARFGWGDALSATSSGGIGGGTTGEKAGLLGFCDYRFGGSPFVLGAEVSYDWIFGDMKTAGARADLGVGGRGGFLLNSATLLYGYAGWSQLDMPVKNMDGWKVGPGIEMRLANTPLFLDVRATYGTYAGMFEEHVAAIPASTGHPAVPAHMMPIDGHTYDLMAHLKFKFGMGD